jgi:hypothetical protein
MADSSIALRSLNVARVQMITNSGVFILDGGGRRANCPRIASIPTGSRSEQTAKMGWADVSFPNPQRAEESKLQFL